jgi:hypothetical protein
MTTAFDEINRVLQVYFDALHFCDTEKLQAAFHRRAIYATADEMPLLYRTMDEYVPVVAARQSPASRGEARRDFIDSIDVAGENTARARSLHNRQSRFRGLPDACSRREPLADHLKGVSDY